MKQDRRFIDQYRAGLTVREIAETNGVSSNVVNYNFQTYHAEEYRQLRRRKWVNVLAFVVGYKEQWEGCAPVVGEIARGCGYSTGAVRGILGNLKREGKIKFTPTGKIMVVGGQWSLIDKQEMVE